MEVTLRLEVSLGGLIRRSRVAKRQSIESLAARANVSPNTLQRLESDSLRPNLNLFLLDALCEALGLDVHEVLRNTSWRRLRRARKEYGA